MTGFWTVSIAGRVLRVLVDGPDAQLRAKSIAGNSPGAKYEFIEGEMPSADDLEDWAQEFKESWLEATATAFLEANGLHVPEYVDPFAGTLDSLEALIEDEVTQCERPSGMRWKAIS